MKKSLLAVAAIGAFASAAQAQSSVTVYGILDVGYVGGTTRVSNSGSTMAAVGGTTKTNVSQFGQSAETTSRLGFKGTEDLGGGTSAFFTAEFQLFPQDQTLSGNTSNATTGATSGSNAAGLVNRQTFVGLKKNGVGEFALGTQYTSVFNAQAATDPGQTNNIVGSVMYPSATAVQAPTDYNNGTLTTAFTNRTSNTLTVKSNNYAGFVASGFYTLNNKTSTSGASSGVVTSGGTVNAQGWGLRGEYTLNKFYVTAAYQALEQVTDTLTVATDSKVWSAAQGNGATTAATSTAGAYGVHDNQFLAGATYDFGILKAYAQYANRKATSTVDTSVYLKRTAEQIGVRSFITPKIEAWAMAGLGRYQAFGSGAPTANFNAYQLGSNYWLSKRTNVYAIYGQQNVSQAAAQLTTGTVTGSSNANNYAVGVRHTF